MTDGPRRKRRRLVVPLLGLGIAAWAVHRRVAGRPDLTAGWQRLPPAPRPVGATPAATSVTTPSDGAGRSPMPATNGQAGVDEGGIDGGGIDEVTTTEFALKDLAAKTSGAENSGAEDLAAEDLAVDEGGAEQLPFDEPPVEQLPFEEPAAEAPVAVHARAVPAAAAVASVTAPALPDEPFGAGSLRALADGSSPDPGYAVKGKTATKVFHAPGGAYYTRTRADVWFRTARDARAAGFTERGPRRHG